jgi:hypothetical protein
MLFNMDEGDTRKRRHDVRHASQLLPLARSLYLSAISCYIHCASIIFPWKIHPIALSRVSQSKDKK